MTETKTDMYSYISKLKGNGATMADIHAHLLAPRSGKTKPLAMFKWPEDENVIQATYNELSRAFSDGNADKNLDHLEDLGIESASDLWGKYIERNQGSESSVQLDLSRWLAGLSGVRPLIPGDLLLIIADTGCGKSAVLQNIAVAHPNLLTLFFQIELSGHTVAERFQAITQQLSAIEVEKQSKEFDASEPPPTTGWDHIWTCTESVLDLDGLERRIEQADRVMPSRPSLVMIDYVGLVQGNKRSGQSLYERSSEVAEYLRVLAKKTNTICIVASQIARPFGKEAPSPSLHSPKNSGSLECSASVVISLERPEQDLLKTTVLKDTRGMAGAECVSKFIGSELRIVDATPGDWEPRDTDEF